MHINYKDKKWLQERYSKDRLPARKIGKLCNVSGVTIDYWLKKFNIHIRSLSESHKGQKPWNKKTGPHTDSIWLRKKYLDEKLSSVQIAKISNVSKKIILKNLKIFNINRRTISEAAKLKLTDSVKKKISIKIKELWRNKEYKTKMVDGHKNKIGDKSSHWKGGISLKDGRIYILAKNHPNVNQRGYIRRSHLIAEKALGRYLKKDEMVHHVNGNVTDDRNSNLLICKKNYHNWLHARINLC